MEELSLVLPSEAYAEQVMAYRREFEAAGEVLHGSAGLDSAASFARWLAAVEANTREETAAPGLVPATLYLCVRRADDRLVGMIHIRHRLNDYLLAYGGHIGYSVRVGERRKGYAGSDAAGSSRAFRRG